MNIILYYKKNTHGFFLNILIIFCSLHVLSPLNARENLQTTLQKKTTEPKKTIQLVPKLTTLTEEIVLPSRGTKLSLEQIHAASAEKKKSEDVPIRSLHSLIKTSSDLYTQSQAHMSIPEIKKLIDSTYDIKPYTKLVKSILDCEKKYTEKYVFYHGTDNVWRVPQDLYTKLYFHFNPAQKAPDFIFLRFEPIKKATAIQDFLIQELNKGGLINDHSMGFFLMAANLALFSNVGTPPECTWQYFIKSRGHTNPDRAIYEKIMNTFGLTHKYIDELMALPKLYTTSEQTILQIFIPKEHVDAIGYLAWIRGIPAHQKTIHTILGDVTKKIFDKTAPAIEHYAKIFRIEHEKNPLFKNFIDHINAGYFSLGYFLEFYRNRPSEIQDINNFQARLFLTQDVLLNPLSGVKMFRYSTATDEQLKKYEDKLETIIKKIISEKNK